MAYNGTLYRGTASFGAGKFGNASNSGVYATSPAYPTSAVGTIEGWVKASSTSVMIAFGDARNGGVWIGMLSGGYAGFQINGGSGTATDVPIGNGVWHHLALVADGTNWTYFVDGVAKYQVASAAAMTVGATPAIGGYTSYAPYDWSGQLDEMRLSNSVRYPGTTTFTPTTTAFTSDANTVALYHLESDASDSATAAVADTTAPTVPTGVTATPGNAQVVVSWTASTDAVGVTGYRIYRGGTLVGSPTGTAYTDTGLTNGTTYSYTVAAIDAAGNLSATSSAVTATPAVPADTTPPTVPGTPTAAAALVSATVTFTASTDAVGVTGYRVYSSADNYVSVVATGTSSPITVSGLNAATSYTFKVAAVDAAGNVSAQSPASGAVFGSTGSKRFINKAGTFVAIG